MKAPCPSPPPARIARRLIPRASRRPPASCLPTSPLLPRRRWAAAVINGRLDRCPITQHTETWPRAHARPQCYQRTPSCLRASFALHTPFPRNLPCFLQRFYCPGPSLQQSVMLRCPKCFITATILKICCGSVLVLPRGCHRGGRPMIAPGNPRRCGYSGWLSVWRDHKSRAELVYLSPPL